jgi:hypothetical protein
LAAVRREAAKLQVLDPQPVTYTFVTSQALTPKGKARIASALKPWIHDDSQVLGAHDLELLLHRHPDVERRQVKLWLTGGTQLAALLKAGTITRSQTLLEEIARAMPRYVQGRVFSEARNQLRAEHVLVIAGVPGIGKTTLARVLLADAAMDGYEAIEVSKDIEEAWELVDDGVKQVFLYDDFLGRTALAERFAKNEDRRLIDFMRRAARRRSTLFLLTTREYILRQAVQFYERLEQEHLEGRRFLLELNRYSRLDRARIFANHAFHSPELTPAAKRSLLDERSYRRVIDHRNYNPRTIEWITGLAGHRLTTEELGRYVDFAVDSLNHPERIWRHAFEREIDDHGRMLLLALATLPNGTALTHLEQAFAAVCRVAGLSLGGRAFNRSLAALDDSFIRTAHDGGDGSQDKGIVVGPYDPSVVDFLRDYLRTSPGDASLLVQGAEFFEQVEWLYAALSAQGHPSRDVIDGLSDAAMRTFEAPGLRVIRVRVTPNAWRKRPHGSRDIEARLLGVYRLFSPEPVWSTGLSHWWCDTFAARTGQWEEGNGEPESLIRLLETVDPDAVEDFPRAIEGAKAVLRSDQAVVQSYEWLIELRDVVPGTFSVREWADVVDDFARWLEAELLSEVEDMSTEEELSAVERVAERLGVEIDQEDLEEASETLSENIAAREAEIDPDPEPDTDPVVLDYQAENQEIEAIFVGLADTS